MNLFYIYQGEKTPQYAINLSHVCDIDMSNPESWEVTTASGEKYALECDDLARFQAQLK